MFISFMKGGKYSAFGLSNLATTKEYRDRMVEKGIFNLKIFSL